MCTPDFLPGRMQTVANGLLQLLFLALKWTNRIIISPTNTRCKDKLTVLQLRHCLAPIDVLTEGKVKTPNATWGDISFHRLSEKRVRNVWILQGLDCWEVEKRAKLRVTEGQL